MSSCNTELHPTTAIAQSVVTDLTVCFSSANSTTDEELDSGIWHRVEKDLYLHTAQQNAWLYIAQANEVELTDEDLVVVDIRVGERPPDPSSDKSWEGRPCGIWILRSRFAGNIDMAATEVDVLFGIDAVDPRPQWTLMRTPLQIDAQSQVPVARLSVHRGRIKLKPNVPATLRINEDGRFKILQISDTHMVTGIGVCKDAIDAHGNYLPASEADPLTTSFMGKILDLESPDLVVLTGDQLHHDILDSQSTLLKVVAPIIQRSIPFAAVFGNHDSEGVHALSRTTQMSILQSLPFSLCEPGPKEIDGIGNFYLNILAPSPSQLSLSTLYFLDSHSQIPSKNSNPDYEPIQQSQIDWFVNTSQQQRSDRQKSNDGNSLHLSLVFQHIPVPEFGDRNLSIRSGHRREPTEGPSVNTQFYDVLVKEGVSALGCGHDHVNDFCALLPRQLHQDSNQTSQLGPWLCYGGGSGFGGYCSYGKKRFYRRMRVWELDAKTGSLKTWSRVEYASDRIDEVVLLRGGEVVDESGEKKQGRSCVLS